MKFPKDILIIDFEGLMEPVQIGAVLLDRETLAEKASFVSYIWTDLRGQIKLTTGISQDDLKGAPTQAQVGQKIFETFGTNIFIAAWVAVNDVKHFSKLMSAAGIDMKKYDYHVMDLWPIAYVHLLKKGYRGSVRSEEIFRAFGAKARGLHDALEDSRIAADVLRQVVKEDDENTA